MNTLEILKSLSEPQRVRILNLLKISPLTVTEIVQIMGSSQSNISHHIKIMKDLDLISFEKKGNQNYYTFHTPENLSPHMRELLEKTPDIAREIVEAAEDQKRLLMVISSRSITDNGDPLQQWRESQGDLPYAMEVAFYGKPVSGLCIDIGCGQAGFFHLLKSSFQNLIGIDVSLSQLQKGETTFKQDSNVSFLYANASNLPLKDNTADSVYFRMTLGFIDDKQQAIGESVRVLKPGGRISIVDHLASKNNKNYFQKEYFRTLLESLPAEILSYQVHDEIFIISIEKRGSTSKG